MQHSHSPAEDEFHEMIAAEYPDEPYRDIIRIERAPKDEGPSVTSFGTNRLGGYTTRFHEIPLEDIPETVTRLFYDRDHYPEIIFINF